MLIGYHQIAEEDFKISKYLAASQKNSFKKLKSVFSEGINKLLIGTSFLWDWFYSSLPSLIVLPDTMFTTFVYFTN